MLKKPVFIPVSDFYGPTSQFGPVLKTMLRCSVVLCITWTYLEKKKKRKRSFFMFVYLANAFASSPRHNQNPSPVSPLHLQIKT